MHFFFILAPVSPGLDGQLESSYLKKLDLSRRAKEKYPLALIKLMTRYGEDLIWANKITNAETVLKFTVTLTEGRSDASELRTGEFIFSARILLNKYIASQLVINQM